MSDLDKIDSLVSALLQNTGASARRQVLGTAAREVRKSQSDRIARQQQPDGSAFAPRKSQPEPTGKHRRKGRIRQKAMFRKLRLAKFLKAGATSDEAWVGFAGRAAAIARIHQEGLEDSPRPGARRVRYARRVLLGLTDEEQGRLLDLVLQAVAR